MRAYFHYVSALRPSAVCTLALKKMPQTTDGVDVVHTSRGTAEPTDTVINVGKVIASNKVPWDFLTVLCQEVAFRRSVAIASVQYWMSSVCGTFG